MQLEFAEHRMRRLAEEVDYQPPAWGDGVTRAYRKIMQLLSAATNIADLRALRSVGLTEHAGADGDTEAGIPLSDQMTLILRFRAGQDEPIAVVVGIIDRPIEGTGNE